MSLISSPALTDQRTALYMRVSTQEQKIDGYGLEAQYKALKHYTKANSQVNYITNKEWEYTDAHTGSDIMRPGLQSLLTAIKKGEIDTVIVWKIDRLSRSMKHLLTIFESFKKYGINFISVQENMNFNGAVGNFIFNILSSVAELERSMIKVRTRAGILASAEMGNYTGTAIPYGYKSVKNKNGKGKRLEIIPRERDTVRQIFSWYIYDERGFLSIANRLNDENIPLGSHALSRAKTKIEWTHRHVEKIIKNPLYRGEFIANRKDEKGFLLPQEDWTIVSIPPCVDELMYTIAQRKMKERKGHRKRTGHVYLLSGKLVDISTSKQYKFSGFPRTKGGWSYRRKPFTDKLGIKQSVFEFPAEVAEDIVWRKILLAMQEPEKFINQHINREKNKEQTDEIGKKLLQFREQKVNLELEHGRIERAYKAGFYTLEKAELKTSELEQQEDRVFSQIDELEKNLHRLAFLEQEILAVRNAAKEVHYNLDKMTRKEKRLLIDVFVDRIEIFREEIHTTKYKRKKWKRTLEIFFRFHPDSSRYDLPDARTHNARKNGQKGTSESDNINHGARGGRGWQHISIKFEFVKQHLDFDIPGRSWKISLKEIAS